MSAYRGVRVYEKKSALQAAPIFSSCAYLDGFIYAGVGLRSVVLALYTNLS